MGGEKRAVLMYGPKKRHSFMELVELFRLVDKKKWVKKFLETEDHTYEEPYDEDEDIETIFDQEFSDAAELVMKFLSKSHLSIAFDNNCDWSECCIGAIVDEYEMFLNHTKMKKVNNFCEKYNLPKPTFFGGIIGEFE